MLSRLDRLVARASTIRPKNKAVIEAETGCSITYKELDDKAQALSDHLLRCGLKKGERAGIIARNSISSIIAFFAISRAGGVIVVFNYELGAAQIADQAAGCGLSALYTSDEFLQRAREIKKRTRSVRFIVREADGLNVKTGTSKNIGTKEKAPALIIYTSGTTGRPLGVTLSHRNLIHNALSVARYTRISSADRICCVLPFHYIYGLSLLLSHFIVGATVIIDNRFMYPRTVLDGIKKYKAAAFAGVGSHYSILLYKAALKKRRLNSLKYFLQAGDAMPVNTTRELIRAFPRKKLYLMYGLTEASPRLTYLEPSLASKKPSSVGRAIIGVRIKIVDKKGRNCAAYRTGRIAAKGPNIMLGYWRNPSETKKILIKGWLYTGDLGYKDDEGDLFITGREKKVIKTGGKLVSLAEIEKPAMELSAVMEVAAIGVPDSVLGEKIRLFVALVPGKKISVSNIIEFYKRRLPYYKLPAEIVIVKAIHKNSFGKIDTKKMGAL